MVRVERGLILLLRKLGIRSADEYHRRISVLRSANIRDFRGWYIKED